MVDGWPIAHHVFEGNRRDAKTVPAGAQIIEVLARQGERDREYTQCVEDGLRQRALKS
jgi:hypothetical protein